MINFIRTPMGQGFFQGTLPNLLRELKRIADGLERLNDNMETKIPNEEPEGYVAWRNLVNVELGKFSLSTEGRKHIASHTNFVAMFKANYEPETAAYEILVELRKLQELLDKVEVA